MENQEEAYYEASPWTAFGSSWNGDAARFLLEIPTEKLINKIALYFKIKYKEVQLNG